MWGVVFALGMALVSGFAQVPGSRYSSAPQEVRISAPYHLCQTYLTWTLITPFLMLLYPIDLHLPLSTIATPLSTAVHLDGSL